MNRQLIASAFRRTAVLAAVLVLLVLSIARAQPDGVVPGVPGAGAALGPQRAKAAVLPVQLDLDNVMASSVRRRIAAAQKDGCDLIVFDLDTAGGYLPSAIDIARAVRGANIPTVAYVRGRALFGGALVAMACRQIIMTPDSRLGYCPPTEESAGAFLRRPAAERQQVAAAVLADLDESARQFAWPAQTRLVARAMVFPDVELHVMRNAATGEVRYVDDAERKRLLDEEAVNAEGQKTTPWKYVPPAKGREVDFLTVTAAEAADMGLAARLVPPEQLQATLNAVEMVTYPLSFLENATLYLTQWPVRMAIFVAMLVCAYIELSHPGISVAGIAAVVLLALLVGAPYLTGLAQVWEIVLIVLGLAIIIADIAFVGTVGLLAVPGFILMAIGLVATFVPSAPGGGWAPSATQLAGLQRGAVVVVFGSLLALGVFFFLSRFLYMAPGFRRLQLAEVPALPPHVVKDAADRAADDAVFVGAIGKAATDLRPSGKARFGDHIVDVVSQGQFISAGTAVQVTEAAFQIVVKPASHENLAGPEHHA